MVDGNSVLVPTYMLFVYYKVVAAWLSLETNGWFNKSVIWRPHFVIVVAAPALVQTDAWHIVVKLLYLSFKIMAEDWTPGVEVNPSKFSCDLLLLCPYENSFPTLTHTNTQETKSSQLNLSATFESAMAVRPWLVLICAFCLLDCHHCADTLHLTMFYHLTSNPSHLSAMIRATHH